MRERLNFAPRPFKFHRKPLLVLWALNLLLVLAVLASLYHWMTLRGANDVAHGEIDRLKQRQRDLVARHDLLLRELDTIDMREYRRVVGQFHDIQTAVQTHWGRLLDDLGTLLPDDVRIIALQPVTSGSAARRETNVLQLSAEARAKPAQSRFIKTLQEHPAFTEIRLESERYDQGNVALAFELRFTYLPGEGS